MARDIHSYDKKLQQALVRLDKEEGIPSLDKKKIHLFVEKLALQNLTAGRRAKYVNHLIVSIRKLVELTKSTRGLAKAKKEDIDQFKIWLLEKSNYQASVKRDYANCLKRFYQWLLAPPAKYAKWKKRHIYPDLVEDLDIDLKRNERFLPSDLLTDDEVNAFIDASDSIMQRAYFGLKSEIGPRPGEDLTMRIADIILDGEDVIARLGHQGAKTGERLIPIIKSAPLITQWLQNHPFRSEPDAPLWISQGNNARFQSWSYAAMRKVERELAQKAQIKKKMTPYLWRHTAASRDAELGFTEILLCKKYGWEVGSKMPQVYLHIRDTALKAKIREVYGMKPKEEIKQEIFNCPRCKDRVHPTMHFCPKCGAPTKPEDLAKKSIEIEEIKLKYNQLEERMQAEIKSAVDEANRRNELVNKVRSLHFMLLNGRAGHDYKYYRTVQELLDRLDSGNTPWEQWEKQALDVLALNKDKSLVIMRADRHILMNERDVFPTDSKTPKK